MLTHPALPVPHAALPLTTDRPRLPSFLLLALLTDCDDVNRRFRLRDAFLPPLLSPGKFREGRPALTAQRKAVVHSSSVFSKYRHASFWGFSSAYVLWCEHFS